MAKKKIDIELNVKTKKAAQDLKTVDQGLSGIGKAGKVAGGGFKIMGTAMKAAGIGVIVALFGKLVEQLMKNQKFMDAINKIFLALEPILMAVAEVIAIVVDGLANMIGATLGAVGATNNLTEGLVDQRNAVRLLEAELGLIQLQYLREAELMRQIRDDESLSINERIEANYELGKVLEEQLQVERSIAMESLRLAELELSRNKTNIDLQVALIESKTKMAEIDERITGQRSEQLVNLNSLERDRKAQQKENAAKREEQLKKEAEMLQNLIDLQNEDIKVKKKAAKTIGEQFENAEEANKAQLEELEKRKKAELDAVDTSVRGAKKNIEAQKEVTAGYTEELKVLEDTNKKKAESVEELIQEQIRSFSEGVKSFDDYDKAQDKLIDKDDELLKMRRDALSAEGDDRITTLEEYEKWVETYNSLTQNKIDTYIDGIKLEHLANHSQQEQIVENTKKARRKTAEANIGIVESSLTMVENLASTANTAIAETTEEQLNQSVQSAASSEQIIATSADKKLAIEKKYAQEIEDTNKGVIDTTTILQEQADLELFLHFETAKEKEIRLVEEKYEKLLGMAEGNAEATLNLEKEKEEALNEIYMKDAQNWIDMIMKKAEETKAQDEIEETEQKERNQKTIDNAVGMMNALLSLSKTKSEKEKTQLEKDLKKGLITEKQYNKKLQQIEAEQLRKEKQAALIQIGVDTARGISGAVQAGAGLVFPANLAAISTGILAVLAGVAQAAGVLGQTVDAGSSDMPDDTIEDMGGDVPAITFGDAGSDAPPVQAYVIETDISNAQALQSELDLQSTL